MLKDIKDRSSITTEQLKIADIFLISTRWRLIDLLIAKIKKCQYNRIGIYVGNRQFVEKRFGRLRVSQINKYKNNELQVCRLKNCTDKRRSQIVDYLLRNLHCGYAYDLCLMKMMKEDREFFKNPTDFPKKIMYKNQREYEIRWNKMIRKIQVADLVFTLDRYSPISWLIIKIDRGIWSHVAGYVGNGQIIEAIFKGVTKNSITKYKKKRYRVGIYRAREGFKREEKKKIVQYAHNTLGDGYAFHKLIYTGVIKLLKLKLPYPPTPRDMIMSGKLKLIAYV